tara:strand:- start:1307 stop:2176 length:870 start_codon:yes stop_codon:yes gene_type:complete
MAGAAAMCWLKTVEALATEVRTIILAKYVVHAYVRLLPPSECTCVFSENDLMRLTNWSDTDVRRALSELFSLKMVVKLPFSARPSIYVVSELVTRSADETTVRLSLKLAAHAVNRENRRHQQWSVDVRTTCYHVYDRLTRLARPSVPNLRCGCDGEADLSFACPNESGDTLVCFRCGGAFEDEGEGECLAEEIYNLALFKNLTLVVTSTRGAEVAAVGWEDECDEEEAALAPSPPMEEEDQWEDEWEDECDEEMVELVNVGGVPKPRSEVTNEDLERMTCEEYDVYQAC